MPVMGQAAEEEKLESESAGLGEASPGPASGQPAQFKRFAVAARGALTWMMV